jgi:muramoyltetrapeptide carboxypeptidase
LNEGIQILESWGLSVHPQALSERRWGYLAGNDQERRADLEPKAQTALLACARGGWGAARLLEEKIAWKPGWLLGFSDVTALLLARLAAGFAGGVHGPLLTTLAAEPKWSQERLRRLLFGEAIPDLHGRATGGAQASGPLIVANLTVATHLLGSTHFPNLHNAILIFEDVGEAPYRIDRMLTQWRLCGALDEIAGLGFGHFEGCDDDATNDPDDQAPPRRFSLNQVLDERTADLGIPRVFDLPVGHRCGNAALPLGAEAHLDGEAGRLRVSSLN